VIAAGAKVSGCTVHFVVPQLDSGPIIAQSVVPVLDGDTPESLSTRVLKEEHKLYPLALSRVIEGQIRLE
jgi:phosphoribosylglycinamide formyltransferase-1